MHKMFRSVSYYKVLCSLEFRRTKQIFQLEVSEWCWITEDKTLLYLHVVNEISKSKHTIWKECLVSPIKNVKGCLQHTRRGY